MIIQCDHCSARFRLDDNKLTESGVKIRCKRCQHVFLVRKELPQEEPPPLQSDLQENGTRGESVPEPPAQGGSWPDAGSAPFFLPEEKPTAAPQEEISWGSRDDAEFALSFEPQAPEPEPSVTSPGDEFSFPFEPAAPATISPAESALQGEEEPPPPEKSAISHDELEFSFTEEKPSPPESDRFDSFETASVEKLPPAELPSPTEIEFDKSMSPPLPELPPTSPSLAEAQTFSDSSKTAVMPPVAPELPPPTIDPAPTDNSASEALLPLSRRQRISPVLLAGMIFGALMLLLLGGVGGLYLLGGSEALQQVGLGAVARLLNPEEQVQARILLKKLEGSYVSTTEGKELFVIRGEAFNSYPTPHAAIQVRGLIYNAAGSVILQKSSYCGNPLTPEQLATLPMAKIEESMNNRLGDSYANIGVPAGKTVPFLIVFSSLPKEAVDFGVEVASSQPVGELLQKK